MAPAELASLLTPWLYGWITVALILSGVLLLVAAPYGRHRSTRWGPTVPDRFAWMLMELVALLGLWWMLSSQWPNSFTAWLAVALWTLHHVHRALIYPLRSLLRCGPWLSDRAQSGISVCYLIERQNAAKSSTEAGGPR